MQVFLSEVSKPLGKRIIKNINYVFVGSEKHESEWDIVREILIEDGSSDDDCNNSFRERPSSRLQAEMF